MIGVLYFLAGLQFNTLLIVAETQFPGYNVSSNYISDLGPWSRPSAIIFDPSVFTFGVLILIASYLLYKTRDARPAALALMISSIGAMGVGIFPETFFFPSTYPVPHVVSALTAFLFGNVGAILMGMQLPSQFRYFSYGLGIMGLGAIVLSHFGFFLGLGVGGIERMILYPVLAWMMGFGGYFMASTHPFTARR